jgi:hypothetical protein
MAIVIPGTFMRAADPDGSATSTCSAVAIEAPAATAALMNLLIALEVTTFVRLVA